MECVVVGAGISGLLCARELIGAGWRVKIIDKSRVGREASWAGAGILSPLYPWRQPNPIRELALWSQQEYPALASSLRESTGIDPEWQRCGMLWLDLPDFDNAIDWCRQHQVACQHLDKAEVLRLQANLNVSAHGRHLWDLGIAQIRNPRLVQALRQELGRLGVEFLERHPLLGWQLNGNRVTSLRVPQGNLSADLFVMAAGAWSALSSPADHWRPEIWPVKGQMLLYRTKPGLLGPMVQRGDHYLIPRLDGRILVGSTVEEADFDKRPTAEAHRILSRFALETFPLLAEFPLELHWAGMRPASPDGIPYIGPHPQLENLYYDCGHFRNGVVMAPAAARLLGDLILGRAPCVDPRPYLPANRP